MKRKQRIYRFIWLFVCLLWTTKAVIAQYTVSGGSKAPLLVVDNKIAKFQVYLVYGMENVTISLTSTTSA
ncbi:MAG: hypothetical protein LBE79_04015, partial [Tannerella sp.]|nr:hypothetical protein [Tannerella sp.]